MKAKEPYIYTTRTDYSVTRDGKRQAKAGIHAIYAAEVPFIPSFLSADFVGSLASGSSRLELIVDRQIKFINDLASVRRHKETFDLRLIFHPSAEQEKQQLVVRLFFLGKVFSPGHDKEEEARKQAYDLWKCFSAHFPLEDPFNYPLVPVDEGWLEKEDRQVGKDHRSAQRAFEAHILSPIALDNITANKLSEIRKFEDWDSIIRETLGLGDSDADISAFRLGYFVHQWSLSGMRNLMNCGEDKRTACKYSEMTA